MGKNPEPSKDEIEFMFHRLQRGLSNTEIKGEYQDTEFPLRTDSRHFAKMRRYYEAAINVLALATTGFNKEKDDHRAFLVGGLEMLRRPHLDHRLPDCWDWGQERPMEMPAVVSSLADNGVPLEVLCLASHLSPDDRAREIHAETGTILGQHWQFCLELYQEIKANGESVAKRLGVPLLLRSQQPVPSLIKGFIDTIYGLATGLFAGQVGSEARQQGYEPRTSERQPRLWGLWFRSTLIAMGTKSRLKVIRDSHERLLSDLIGNQLIERLQRTRNSYTELKIELDRLVDVKARQRVFLKGPCVICASWSGL